MIKTILFDMGGVVITLDQRQAIERFKSLGLADAEQRLDAYTFFARELATLVGVQNFGRTISGNRPFEDFYAI